LGHLVTALGQESGWAPRTMVLRVCRGWETHESLDAESPRIANLNKNKLANY